MKPSLGLEPLPHWCRGGEGYHHSASPAHQKFHGNGALPFSSTSMDGQLTKRLSDLSTLSLYKSQPHQSFPLRLIRHTPFIYTVIFSVLSVIARKWQRKKGTKCSGFNISRNVGETRLTQRDSFLPTVKNQNFVLVKI